LLTTVTLLGDVGKPRHTFALLAGQIAMPVAVGGNLPGSGVPRYGTRLGMAVPEDAVRACYTEAKHLN